MQGGKSGRTDPRYRIGGAVREGRNRSRAVCARTFDRVEIGHHASAVLRLVELRFSTGAPAERSFAGGSGEAASSAGAFQHQPDSFRAAEGGLSAAAAFRRLCAFVRGGGGEAG